MFETKVRLNNARALCEPSLILKRRGIDLHGIPSGKFVNEEQYGRFVGVRPPISMILARIGVNVVVVMLAGCKVHRCYACISFLKSFYVNLTMQKHVSHTRMR